MGERVRGKRGVMEIKGERERERDREGVERRGLKETGRETHTEGGYKETDTGRDSHI